jgi:hypothetical protein
MVVRVHCRADPSLSAAAEASPRSGETPQQAVERAVVTALGYDPSSVLFVSEDPTDEGSFTVLANRAPKPSSPLVTVLSTEPVVDLPPVAKASAPNLDDGLLIDEARAVALALLKDTDPDRLEGMGATFAPDLPVVGALLLTKARLEHVRRAGGQDHHDALSDHRRAVTLARRAKPSVGRSGVGTRGGSAGLATPPGPVEPILAELRKATLDLGPAAASSWDAYAGAVAIALADDPPPVNARDKTCDAIEVRSPVDVERLLGLTISDPILAKDPISSVASLLETDSMTTAAVLSALRPLGGGVLLVDPIRAKALRMGRPPPSVAAIKLSASTVRPKANGLSDPSRIPATFRALMRAGPYDEASAQVDRGKRAVARRNWIEWWKAAERGGLLGDVR